MSLPRSWASNGIAVAFALGTVLIADRVNRQVPLPYLDEIFHIPQARQYCQSVRNAPYDAKLTTPPGLYLLSVFVSQLLPATKCEDVGFLRSTNLVMLLLLPHIISAIIELNGQESEQRAVAAHRPAIPPTGSTVSLPPSYTDSLGMDSAPPRRVFQPSSQQNGGVSRQKGAQPGVSRATIRELQQKAQADATPPAEATSQPLNGRPSASPDPLKDILGKYTVQSKLSARRKEAYSTALAHTITFLPPLYFFGFLYYTDVGSVFFVLSCMLAVKKGALWLGAALGAASLSFRQTNIVWVLFTFATATLHHLSLRVPELYDPMSADQDLFCVHLLKSVVSIPRLLLLAGTPQQQRQRKLFLEIIWQHAVPLVPLLTGFAYFVYWNGGIVLGDKSNHQMGLHVPQLWYFLLFATVFGWAPLLHASAPPSRSQSPTKALPTSVAAFGRGTARAMFGSLTNAALTIALSGLVTASVHKFTIHHPFLLADNRHYTFYLWRRFRAHRAIPFTLVPVYTVLLCAWTSAAGRQGRSVLWITAFALCTAATLVPSPLVEPRYFLTPYLILRIHVQPSTQPALPARWLFLALEFATALLVNAATLYLFLYKPFAWPATGVDTARGESTVMRFMW